LQDANRLYLVLEFCAGGDLGHYLRRYRQVSEATARYFLQQVAEGLKELRRHNVIHVSGTVAHMQEVHGWPAGVMADSLLDTSTPIRRSTAGAAKSSSGVHGLVLPAAW
jgi:hypothetical protein